MIATTAVAAGRRTSSLSKIRRMTVADLVALQLVMFYKDGISRSSHREKLFNNLQYCIRTIRPAMTSEMHTMLMHTQVQQVLADSITTARETRTDAENVLDSKLLQAKC